MIHDLSIGILSYHAHETIRTSLENHIEARLHKLPSNFFVYFNDITDADRKLAKSFDIAYYGGPNSGIYGGFKAIAEHSDTEYILILENDMMSLPDEDIIQCVSSGIEDMKKYDINIFSLKCRFKQGQGSSDRKYRKAYGIKTPLFEGQTRYDPTLFDKLQMTLKHGYLSKFRGRAIASELEPEKVQPLAIKKLPSGNFLTDSRYVNWGNQALLVKRSFFLNIVCNRVETHPDPRTVNGFQDIERAMNCGWWRRRKELYGYAERGCFSHSRVDR